MHTCDPCTQKVEARKSGVRGHLWLHKEGSEGKREGKRKLWVLERSLSFDFIPACSAFAWPLGGTVAFVRREVLLILPDTVTWGTMARAGVPESVQEHTLEFRGLALL